MRFPNYAAGAGTLPSLYASAPLYEAELHSRQVASLAMATCLEKLPVSASASERGDVRQEIRPTLS